MWMSASQHQTLNVDTAGCLKPCSGLVVTGVTKSEVNKYLENTIPMYEAYNQYKKATTSPSGFNGKCCI